jgi:hypothetical protein
MARYLMSKPHESYRVYRALLHLYPKSHRRAYGRQMVQTLDDILSEQEGRYGRFTVWLRVFFELPINIIEENLNSRGDMSVNKLTKISNRQLIYMVLAILVIGSYVGMAIIWRHQRTEVNSLNAQLQTVSDNQVARNGGSYNDVTIIPSEDAVYFPLAKLKLPATILNEGLVYNYANPYTVPGSKKVFPAQLNISTHFLAVNNYSTTRQFDCSQVAYADFVTPSYALNPMWKSDGNVKLSDGRTMNVYYATSIPGCKQAWQLSNVDSKAIADSIKQAVSY